MEKYYTPKIEEFHAGFEYEHEEYKGNNNWFKNSVKSESSLAVLTSCLKVGIIRVKHLDKEDIESLNLLQDTNWISNIRYKGVRINKKDYILEFYPTEKEIIIHNDESYEEHVTLFDGKINNKSELIKILKMIGYDY